MKTIEEWLSELPEPYKTQALENAEEAGTAKENGYYHFSTALMSAFDWSDAPNGFGYDYWEVIAKSNGKLFPPANQHISYMTKEEAAEKWAEKYLRGKVDTQRCGDLIEAHNAGWEAHEAQSPTDAVAFAEWFFAIGLQYSRKGLYSVQPGSGLDTEKLYTAAELYKLFNPSGAATQPAGPVWVKASERIPKHPGDPNIHYRLDGNHKVSGNFHYSIDDERCEGEIVFTVIGNGLFADFQIPKEKWASLEWLDNESAPQLFTREQVEHAILQAREMLLSGQTLGDGFDWQNTPNDIINNLIK